MTHLFLSPHYDDAVYSCGGMIYELSRQGEEVTILTVMAGRPSLPLPDTPVLKDNHERWQAGHEPIATRRAEDQQAAKILGTKTQYLDIPDCIYRLAKGEALYPSEESLWGNVHADDSALATLQNIDLANVKILYAPMAVGKHVDHQLVRNWAWDIAKTSSQTVKFYQDYPYMRQKEAIDAARLFFDEPLLLESIKISEQAMQQKISAMAAYVSQIHSFWEDEAAIDSEVRQTFTDSNDSDYIECLWVRQS
jgi:LmbE family N-acetylglucosaminyl deacetylase